MKKSLKEKNLNVKKKGTIIAIVCVLLICVGAAVIINKANAAGSIGFWEEGSWGFVRSKFYVKSGYWYNGTMKGLRIGILKNNAVTQNYVSNTHSDTYIVDAPGQIFINSGATTCFGFLKSDTSVYKSRVNLNEVAKEINENYYEQREFVSNTFVTPNQFKAFLWLSKNILTCQATLKNDIAEDGVYQVEQEDQLIENYLKGSINITSPFQSRYKYNYECKKS